MSNLTYKVRHSYNFSAELSKAFQIALFAVKTGSRSSADVRHIGLKSALANQILRKYSRNSKIKTVRSVKLTVPSQAVKYDGRNLTIGCLKAVVPFNRAVLKINQIELDNEFAFVTCTVKDEPEYEPTGWIGIDRNAAGHAAVCSVDTKIIKMGKRAAHVRRKYYSMRKKAQKKGQYKFLKKIRDKESRIIRDICHKMSRKIVDTAVTRGYGIKFEQLKGIRKQKKKKGRGFNRTVSNWPFYQLEQFVLYKARLLGAAVSYVDPYMTSQRCSVCGQIGIREGRKFACICGHKDHADANAAFNIAKAPVYGLSGTDRDVSDGATDGAGEALRTCA